MKGIVIYSSKTGFTEKYAKWIADELKYDMIKYREMEKRSYDEYDLIIFGGGLMAGKVSGLDKIKNSKNFIKKKLIIFATGATANEADAIIEKIKNDNLTLAEQKEIPFFYFQGGIDYEKMGFLSKNLLKTMYKSLNKKTDRTEEETSMMNALEKSQDYSDKKNIMQLVEYVKKI